MKNKKHIDAEKAQRIAGSMANQTKGRARTFANKKRVASKNACRGKMGGDF